MLDDTDPVYEEGVTSDYWSWTRLVDQGLLRLM